MEVDKYCWRDGWEEKPEHDSEIFFYYGVKLREGKWDEKDQKIYSPPAVDPIVFEYTFGLEDRVRFWMYKPALTGKLHCCVSEDIECKDDGEEGLFLLRLHTSSSMSAVCNVEYCPICGEKALEKK